MQQTTCQLASQLAGCSARATAHGGTGSVTCSKPSSNHDAWLYLWSCTAPACACLCDGLGRQNLRQFAAVIMHHWFHPHSRMHNMPKRTSAMQVPPWCSGWLPAGGTADQDHPQQQGPGCNLPATWYQGHLHSRCRPHNRSGYSQPLVGCWLHGTGGSHQMATTTSALEERLGQKAAHERQPLSTACVLAAAWRPRSDAGAPR